MMEVMADKEIVKALECCMKDDCDNCPCDFGNCYSNLAGYALCLINHQKAEIDKLKIRLNTLYGARAEAIKEFAARLKEEIRAAIRSNDEAIRERVHKHGVNRYEDNFCVTCDAKIVALSGIEWFIDSIIWGDPFVEGEGDTDG